MSNEFRTKPIICGWSSSKINNRNNLLNVMIYVSINKLLAVHSQCTGYSTHHTVLMMRIAPDL